MAGIETGKPSASNSNVQRGLSAQTPAFPDLPCMMHQALDFKYGTDPSGSWLKRLRRTISEMEYELHVEERAHSIKHVIAGGLSRRNTFLPTTANREPHLSKSQDPILVLPPTAALGTASAMKQNSNTALVILHTHVPRRQQ